MSRTHYRIIYNHDGGTLLRPFHPFTGMPFSIEGFVDKTIGFLAGTQVDAVTWTLGTDNGYVAAQQGPGRAANLYCHETDVGERFYELPLPFQSKIWHLHARRVRAMIEQALRDSHDYGLGADYDFAPLREIGDPNALRFSNKHYKIDNLGVSHKYIDSGAFHEWSESLQERFLRSEMGTASARTELPARLEEGGAVTLHFSAADDSGEAAAHALTMTAVLTLRFRDLTGGDHVITLLLNGTHVHRTLLQDEFPLRYTVETHLDPALLTSRGNELVVKLDRGNPEIISELWLDDVEILIQYMES